MGELGDLLDVSAELSGDVGLFGVVDAAEGEHTAEVVHLVEVRFGGG